MVINFQDILAAEQRIAGQLRRTTCEQSVTLSRILGAEIFIKFENMQFTAAFKERGALNKLLLLREQGQSAGVIAMSAGNHAKAVAYHATRLGIPATIVMPRFTPNVKVADTEALGATVVLEGDTLVEASDCATQLARDQGLDFVHPYDDPAMIAGQGTAALEMLADQPDLDALLVPVGGGGLIAGMALAAKELKPGLEVLGVQSDLYPAVQQLLAGEAVSVGGSTIAEGIAVKHPGDNTLALIREHVSEVLTVSEASLERAVSLYINIEKTVAEGAGAASLAAVLQYPERFAGRRVGVVLSGANVDAKVLAYILLRDLAHAGRLVRLKVTLDDRPGALSLLTALVGDQGGNILDVEHQRVFSTATVRETVIGLSVEVREREQGLSIRQALSDAGFQAEILDL